MEDWLKIILWIFGVVVIYYILKISSKLLVSKSSKLRFCPKCGTQNIHLKSYSGPMATGGAGYVCRDCGHKAIMFPVAKNEEFLKKAQRKLGKKK